MPETGAGRLGVAGGEADLGAQAALALADALGDVGGELLGAEGGLAEDDLVDRLVDDLLEADMWTPACSGLRSTRHSRSAW